MLHTTWLLWSVTKIFTVGLVAKLWVSENVTLSVAIALSTVSSALDVAFTTMNEMVCEVLLPAAS